MDNANLPSENGHDSSQPSIQHNAVSKNDSEKKNGLGIAGFVLAITGIALCWVPILRWLLLIPALLLSIIGLFKEPRTLATVGAVLSALAIILVKVLKKAFWATLFGL